MTRGRAAFPDPIDIGAVNRSGELFDALAARRPADLGDDPAGHLLAALVADVDLGAPPLPVPAHLSRATIGSRRRVVRAFVTLGVTAAVLTSAGAAVAGGGGGDGGDGKGASGARAPHSNLSERTDGSLLQVRPLERPADRRITPQEDHASDGHRDRDARSTHRDDDRRRRNRHDHDARLPDTAPDLRDPGDGDHQDQAQREMIAPISPRRSPPIKPPDTRR